MNTDNIPENKIILKRLLIKLEHLDNPFQDSFHIKNEIIQ